jgi:hypothetical protein
MVTICSNYCSRSATLVLAAMSLGGEGMWRRKKTGVIAVAAGAVLFVVGLADHDVSAEADCESFHEAFPRLVR